MGSKERQEFMKNRALEQSGPTMHPHNQIVGQLTSPPVTGRTSSGIPFYRKANSRISLVPVRTGAADDGDHP